LIVQGLVALLIAANTAAGTRVTNTRVDPYKKADRPALSVYARNDQVNESASSEMEEAHDAEIEIVGSADPVAIGSLMAQVGVVVRADPYLGGLASDSGITRTNIQVVATDGHSDPLVAFSVLILSVRYHIALEPT
jgi:hypothetical protein